jgi:hypothetical protein
MADSHSTALAFHPIANIFPLVGGADLAALVVDIKAHGLHNPITLHTDGSVLDGRNRYRACLAAHITPRFVTWDGKGSALAFVLSLNLHRRHLNESQRAMVAAKIATLERGRPEVITPKGIITQKQAAKHLNVSVHSVQRARDDRSVA